MAYYELVVEEAAAALVVVAVVAALAVVVAVAVAVDLVEHYYNWTLVDLAVVLIQHHVHGVALGPLEPVLRHLALAFHPPD